ncbi:hypothetical protein EVAR_74229_1 [Eumeta japonica]|uniref:Uncharacterized protein n=1 Tax=Eumeta variegata TaxID=151549 RepID=A0A4C1SCC8_EUMVA|nr:hypothetical protein EVAR_74229_1 [Eumeta japonica]
MSQAISSDHCSELKVTFALSADAGRPSRSSNLVRLRRSALGKSAPTLSVHVKEPCAVSRRPSRLPPPPPHHRLSLVVSLRDRSDICRERECEVFD